MKKFLQLVIVLAGMLHLANAQNLVTYAGNSGDERFNALIRLSDSTYVVGGVADDLKWVPSGITPSSISSSGINNSLKVYKKTAFLLHLSANLKSVLHVVYFPSGSVQDIMHIRTDNVPGSLTGNIYISGTTIDSRANGGGYFLAKLNNNFIGGTPTGLAWAFNVYATGYYQNAQPWDVGSDGKIIFVTGQPYGKDSAAVLRLKADGSGPDILDQWRTHWGTDITTGKTVGGQYTPASSNALIKTQISALLMNNSSRCELRSWTPADYTAAIKDGNGSFKKGSWPMDMFFSSACDIANPGKTQTNPGYTGMATGNAQTHKVGAITVDRRDNSFYIGVATQATLPSGMADKEPFVMAFSKDGALQWWSRLHKESNANSAPFQEVCAMAVDYSQTGNQRCIAVVARSDGNTANNFWKGNSIVNNGLNPGYSFDNQYTGSDSTILVAWLGKLRITNGDLLYSAYIAGFNSSDPLTQATYTEPIHDNWPSHNAGTPGLDSATVNIDMETDAFGRVYVLASSARFVTTRNAYQKMVKPSLKVTNAQFIRVFEADLSKLAYCSALTGKWSTSSGAGGGNTVLNGVFPIYNGVVVSGYHVDANHDKTSDGNKIPLSHVPTWGDSTPKAEEAILARFIFDTLLKAYFVPSIPTGTCTGTNVTFKDTSIGATSWKWDFGTGSTPSTATGKGPHTVSWGTADTVIVKLVVSNGSITDSMLIPYIISASPTATFSYTGGSNPAPDTVSFSGPTGTGYSYSWDFGDPSSGGSNISTLNNPQHIYQQSGSYTVKLTVTIGNCTASTTQTVTVTGIGSADATFSMTPTNPCENATVTFQQTNPTNSVTWRWYFGQDAIPTNANTSGPFSVTYTSPGLKTAFLMVSNGSKMDTKSFSFNVNSAPGASFTYTGTPGNLPSTYIFNGSTCNGCSYYWDFGDPLSSTGDTSTLSQTAHDYNTSGNYFISYTVTDGNGCSSTVYKEEVIPNYYGISTDFNISPPGGVCVGNKVTVTDMSQSYNSIRKFFFGAGAVPAIAFVSQGFDTASVYWTTPGIKRIVYLDNTFISNSTNQKSILYEVTAYPDASFTYTGITTTSPASLSFSANSKAPGYLYCWDFGDTISGASNKSNSSDPTHKFKNTGVYTVTLAITHNGCTTYYSTNVYIGMATPAIVPAMMITPSKQGCRVPQYIFTDKSTGVITSYSWDFGSGASPGTGSSKGPFTVTYNSVGKKVVKLGVSNGTISQGLRFTLPVYY